MAEIVTSLDPGRYAGARTVTVTFPANTRRAIITRDDRLPVLTEILAYDQGPIEDGGPDVQRPFWSVTQDGRGNVVYDGGFPKFYNTQIRVKNAGTWPVTLPTTLADLPDASHYLLNALAFIANPRKVAAGNRKILFVNNTTRGAVYNLIQSHYVPDGGQFDADGGSGFRDTFQAVCNIGGWVPTFYDRTTASNGQINLDNTYLEQYAGVVYLASDGGSSPVASGITEAFAQAMATYRNAGSGVIIITDHCGRNYTDLDDAVTNGTMFGYDATKVAKYFGAYFSGNVNRSPVLVSEIRSQLGGDHPLLAGLTDTDSIFAGGSESLTVPVLYPDDQVDPNSPWSLTMGTAGDYRLNVLIQLDDGTIITRPLKYTIINPGQIILRDSFNRTVGDTLTTYKAGVDYNLLSNDVNVTAMQGEIRRNGALQGYFTYSNGTTTYQMLSGNGRPMPVASGDVITFATLVPFEYFLTTTVTIPTPTSYWNRSGTLADFIGAVQAHPYFAGIARQAMLDDIVAFATTQYNAPALLGNPRKGHIWSTMGRLRLPFASYDLYNASMKVYPDNAAWVGGMPAFGSIGDAVLVADTNTVYYWDDLPMVWTEHPQKANVLLGLNRIVQNLTDATRWRVGSTSSTVIP